MTAPILEMIGISKSFPGVVALRNVSLTLEPGEVLALAGENGAGKSTLMKILAGAQPADAGEIRIRGETRAIGSPRDATACGVAMMHQELNLLPNLTVGENIMLGREPTRALGFIDRAALRQQARAALARVGGGIDPDALVRDISVAQAQMVEIARAVSQDARIIVMDEPTAAITPREIERLFAVIRALTKQGVGIIYISHRMDEIFEIADRVQVLRGGEDQGALPTAETTPAALIERMIGRAMDEQFPAIDTEPGETLLAVRGLRTDYLKDISFELRRGEVLGVAGLMGSGRTSLARCLFGLDRPTGGEILIDGRPAGALSPRRAIREGIGLLTEDRKGEGLVLQMSVGENMTLAALGGLGPVLPEGELDRMRRDAVARLQIKTPDLTRPVSVLSGGNQQKVVLAKWVLTHARILLFDEPTRGVDVGAKREIYLLVRELVAGGAGVLMISSELPEVLALSHRILVMHDGRVTAELAREEATQQKVLEAAFA